jgi:hypothetical protein
MPTVRLPQCLDLHQPRLGELIAHLVIFVAQRHDARITRPYRPAP